MEKKAPGKIGMGRSVSENGCAKSSGSAKRVRRAEARLRQPVKPTNGDALPYQESYSDKSVQERSQLGIVSHHTSAFEKKIRSVRNVNFPIFSLTISLLILQNIT